VTQRLTGIIAATHTPFNANGDLELSVVPKLAEHLVKSQVAAVFIGGTTGESHSLTLDERLALTHRWVEVVRGSSLQVIVHAGHNAQRDAVTLAGEAARAGAQAVAALSPSFFKPANVADLIRFLASVAAAAPQLPFYYYDIPSMTNVSLPMREFLERVGDSIPNFRGIKYSNPDSVQLQECLRCRDGAFEVFYGIDENLLSALALGVEGAVGSSYNFAAPLYHRIIAAFQAGDWKTARHEQFESVQLIRWLSRFGYLAASKVLMKRLGVDVGTVRPPLHPLAPNAETQLLLGLEESGMLAAIQAK
jgi:N-acetylneuraminate lyase